jgi:hypothetical protein
MEGFDELQRQLQRQEVPEEDHVLVENTVGVMRGLCSAWRLAACDTGYVIRGALRQEFEIHVEDLQLLLDLNPARVEGVAVARAAGSNELIVRLLNAKQPLVARTTRVLITNQTKRRRLW